jgi:hypothetical protein
MSSIEFNNQLKILGISNIVWKLSNFLLNITLLTTVGYNVFMKREIFDLLYETRQLYSVLKFGTSSAISNQIESENVFFFLFQVKINFS